MIKTIVLSEAILNFGLEGIWSHTGYDRMFFKLADPSTANMKADQNYLYSETRLPGLIIDVSAVVRMCHLGIPSDFVR